MGMSGHQLAKELKRHGLPPARTLLVWGRLFQAAQFLNVGKQTVETVAFTVGYANSSALRKAFQFHVGYSPSCVAREGGRSCPALVRDRVWSGWRFRRTRESGSRGPIAFFEQIICTVEVEPPDVL